jgi:hypothetical protein
MGLLADDVRIDRRAGLRALVIVVAILGLGFGTAWLTLGRNARFETMKGVFLSFDLPRTFTQVDEEGAGSSLTSLGESLEIERTYAITLPPPDACRALRRSFDKGDVEVIRMPQTDGSVECVFSGRVSTFSMNASVRTTATFLDHVQAEELDLPQIPKGTRAVASVHVAD